MKKLLLTLVLGLSIGSVLPQAAQAQKLSVSAARTQIQTCYNRYGQAMKTRNLDTINSLLSSDFTMQTMGGKTSDRNAVLNSDRMIFRLPMTYTRYETRITSIQPRGADMIVVTQLTAESVATAGTKSGKSKVVATYRDYWSPFKNANGWVLRQSVERSAEAWINGKKMA